MRKLWILGFLLGGLLQAQAQKEYFFYFQSDNYAPFFLKMNEKVYSAGSEGYLILPRLIDSTYTFSIGRTGTQGESRFTVPVNQKDRGFLIREQENRFQLFDLQTLRTIQPQETGYRSGTSFIKKDDPFTRLLALAADDTSLLYVYTEPEKPKTETAKAPVPKTETETIKDPVRTGEDIVAVPRPADTTEAVLPVMQDTAASANTTRVADAVAQQTNPVSDTSSMNTVPDSLTLKPPRMDPDTRAIAEQAVADTVAVQSHTVAAEPARTTTYYKKSVVLRKSESSTTEGFGLVFLDSHEGGVDTIRLLIPNPKFAYEKPAAEEPAETKKFLDVTTETKAADPSVATPTTTAPAKNPACRAVAGNADFLRLRRYMAGRTTEADMVAEAKKYFRTRCFTTEQVKHLGTLFLTDRGKYLFFEAAMTHVSDRDNFSGLQSEFADAYFIDRFKVLAGN